MHFTNLIVFKRLPHVPLGCFVFMQKCAKALAFLPVVHGDASSWSSFIRRVLIAINSDLDFVFRGMEDRK